MMIQLYLSLLLQLCNAKLLYKPFLILGEISSHLQELLLSAFFAHVRGSLREIQLIEHLLGESGGLDGDPGREVPGEVGCVQLEAVDGPGQTQLDDAPVMALGALKR